MIDLGAAPASGYVSFKDVATNQIIASNRLEASTSQFRRRSSVDAGPHQVQSFRVVDFNGDGLSDIILASNNILGIQGDSGTLEHNQLNLVLNDASHPGTFLAPKVYSQQPFGGPISLATGDFNGDGLLDVALSGDSSTTEGLMIYTNNPANHGAFLNPVLYPNNFPLLRKNLMDLNGDGLTDVDWSDANVILPAQNQYNSGYVVQLARRTETAMASNVNSGTTSYAYADYEGDSLYGSVASCEIPLDMTAGYPVISSPTVSNVTKTTATISWTSNVATYGTVYYQINYQLDPAANYLPETTRWDPKELTTHSFILSNLAPGTPYVFDIQSQAYFSGCNHYTPSWLSSPR